MSKRQGASPAAKRTSRPDDRMRAAFNAAALTVPADNKQSNGHHLTHVRVYADWGDDGLFMRQVQQYAPRSHGSMPWRIDYEDSGQVGALLRAAAAC